MSNPTFHDFLKTSNEIYSASSGVYHMLAKQFGLSDCAFWILYTARERKSPFTQAELCVALSLPKQTVNSALKALEREGYLVLRTGEKNRREKYIELTPAGVAFAGRTVDHVFELERRAFLQLAPEERGLLLQISEKHLLALKSEAEDFCGGEEALPRAD